MEQQWEAEARNKKTPAYELDGDIKDTMQNLKVAEAMIGKKWGPVSFIQSD